MKGIKRLLVANRGEISLRIIRACFDEDVESVLAVSEADADGLPATLADQAICIGPGPASESYLSVERIVSAAQVSGCDAIHPGYGFLSEQPELAEACEEHGLIFVGPSPDVLRRGGDKTEARRAATAVGVPTCPASPASKDPAILEDYAESIGFPILIKAAAGGGGKGMSRVDSLDDYRREAPRAIREATDAFGDGRIFVERLVEKGRHVEVQIIGDGQGGIVHLGDRDCSTQRRYQKVIEEAPAPNLDQGLREQIHRAAVAVGESLDYCGAGTVEFLVDVEADAFYFLEVNARLQVEHPVTEAVTGVDIVRQQLRVASGRPLELRQENIRVEGHAFEFRITAERPERGFLPQPGLIRQWAPPVGHGIRVDSHIQPGSRIPPFYDSLIAKLICVAPSRGDALELGRRGLAKFTVTGIGTNVKLISDISNNARFAEGPVHTKWLEDEFMPRWIARVSDKNGEVHGNS